MIRTHHGSTAILLLPNPKKLEKGRTYRVMFRASQM